MYHIYPDETEQTTDDGENTKHSAITGIYGEHEELERINTQILSIIQKYGSNEIKYEKIKNDKHIKIITECFDLIFPMISSKQIQIYSICRNTLDSRYSDIGKIDTNKDFDIMMYHLIKGISRRIGPGIPIACFLDERNQSKREDIKYFINQTKIIKQSDRKKIKQSLLDIAAIYPIEQTIVLEEITGICSHDHGLVQLSDLIWGIIACSCVSGEDFFDRLDIEKSKGSLFPIEEEEETKYSGRKLYKFKVLKLLNSYCKKYKLQISLETEKKLLCKKDNGFYIHHYEA